jgi:hypothetical protein
LQFPDTPPIVDVIFTGDKPQISGEIAEIVVSPIKLKLRDIPVFKTEQILEEFPSVFDPRLVDTQTPSTIVRVS